LAAALTENEDVPMIEATIEAAPKRDRIADGGVRGVRTRPAKTTYPLEQHGRDSLTA